MELPTWLLRSRVLPPRHTQRLIPRGRALQILRSAQPGRVVVTCAPPGFGKTVALGQWFEAAQSARIRAAWLRIDSADEPGTVVAYLAFACHVVGLDLSQTELLRRTGQPLNLSLSVQSLLSCIEQTAAPWLLIIDDAERASAAIVRGVFEPLSRFLPANLTLAFGSRDPAILDLSDLEQRGLVVSLGADTLRFTRDEIRQLWGRTASDSQIRAVELRSGGWPALLQLMLEQGSTPHFDTTAASGCGAAAVTAFFESRLLARMDPGLRNCLFSFSLLERFSVALASRLTGATDIEQVVARLATLGIVTPSPGLQGVEFAIHPLLRTYLAARFTAEQPEAARRLHMEVARHCLTLGHYVQATRHAAAAGDQDFLGDVVEAASPLLLGVREGYPHLRQIVRLVPNVLARQRPHIGYACVANYIKAGRLKEAKKLFSDLEVNVRSIFAREAKPSPILFERALCHSLLAVYKGTPITEGDIEGIEQFVAETPSLAPMVLSLAETLRSFVQAQGGHFANAKASAERAIAYAREGDSAYAAYFMYCDLAMITGVEGEADRAFEFLDEGDRACRSTIRLDERLTAIRDAFRLELEHELDPGDTARSSRLKNVCVRLPNLEGWLDVYASGFRTYSEQLFLGGNVHGALAILSTGIDHLREQEIEGIPDVLAAQRVLLLALAGKVEAACDEFRAIPGSDLSPGRVMAYPWRISEALIEAAASIDLASGKRRSLACLANAIATAQRTGNVRSEIRFRRLWSLLQSVSAVGNTAETADERLALLEARSGFIRSTVLYSVFARASVPARRAARAGLPPGHALNPSRSDYLSARELEVILQLERGLSDKQIAMELGITAHGVRYHLKRIYAKLHARDRLEAREKACRLGLM